MILLIVKLRMTQENAMFGVPINDFWQTMNGVSYIVHY